MILDLAIYLSLLLNVGFLFWKGYRQVSFALGASGLASLLVELAPYLSNHFILPLNVLWMLGPTLTSFFVARCFKTNLWGLGALWLTASFLAYAHPLTIPTLLMVFLAFQYLIQFIVLFKNIKRQWTYEQGLAGVLTLGGIGSLLVLLFLGAEQLLFYLLLYYVILILLTILDQYINRIRQLLL